VEIERLSASDELMLWPDELWPQEIGALAILEGGRLFDRSGQFRLAQVRASIAARLHHVRRFRQLLYVPPRRMGNPLWVDDETFDLAEHVNVVPLTEPAGEGQLLLATETLRQHRLDRSRPLWEVWFLTGLAGGRVGMYARMHHCVADGMAGVAALGALLDAAPDVEAGVTEPFTPSGRPSESDLVADARNRRRALRNKRLGDLTHPVSSTRRMLGELPALRELFAEPGPPTSLDRRVGAGRTFALVRADLAAVKRIGHSHGAKVNDVLLATIAGGLRTLIRERGEAVPERGLPIYVPISLRGGTQREAFGNLVTQMAVPLPVGVIGSVERLRLIASETARRKTRHRPSIGGFRVRGMLGLAFLKLIERQRVSVESADLAGPPIPLFLAGAKVLEVFPLLPLVGRVGLGVGALSYAGALDIGIVADRDAYPDVDILAAAMAAELRALESSVTETAVA